MKVPTIKEAEKLLEEGSLLNPGQWVDHCITAAKAAETIAAKLDEIDPGTAYVLGLLHDIGRRAGRYQMRHIIDGYDFMMGKGYEDSARICLTHSFPEKATETAVAKWDCTPEIQEFVSRYLSNIDYNQYDRLIQLCDYLALPEGFCFIEKRMIDVALRYGTNEYTILKWKAIMRIKEEFENRLGCSIYGLLPGIVKNSLGI